MRSRRRSGGGEQGSALVIALFFTTIFAIFVAQVVTFAEAGLRSGRSQDAHRATAYAADGATDAAINRFARGGPCDDYIAPLVDNGAGPAAVNDEGMVVRCQAEAVPGGAFLNKPRHALLALGTDPSEGIASGPDVLRVQGDIFSHSTVTAGAGGALVVQGDISSVGECTPPNPPDRIRVDPKTVPPTFFERCANPGDDGDADPVIGADPDYTRPLDAVPVLRPVPSCPITDEDPDAWLVELSPGYYDDAAALSALTSGSCPNAVLWLRPGDYYFDFTFRPGLGAGTWTVNDATVDVVGGTPKGWNPDGSAPRPEIELPGACKAEGDPAPIDGVQVLMGGESHLHVLAGRVELCAQPSATDQQIALYGNPGERPNRTLKPAGVDPTAFTGQANALLIGEKDRVTGAPAVARAELDATETTQAALTLSGYRPQIPAGALIEKAELLVAHREEGNPVVTPSVISGGNICTMPALTNTALTLTDRAELDLDACGLSAAAGFGDVSVTLNAELPEGGTQAVSEVDGVWLDVTYREPETRKPTAAVDVAGFANPELAFEIGEQPAAHATAALDSSGTTTAELTVRGLGEPPVPPGSVIDSAMLRVAHREDEGVAPPTVSLAVGAAQCTGPALDVSSVSMADDRLDIGPGSEPEGGQPCIDDVADLVGLTATYQVGLGASVTTATAELDGIWLELVYTPPFTRAATGAVGAGFDTPENATIIDGTAAATPAPLTDVTPTASVTLTGYDLPALPAGSVIDSAELRIAHQDPVEVTPTVTVGDGTVCPTATLPAQPALREDGTFEEDVVNLTACLTTTLLTGVSVTFTVTLAPPATVAADVARLDGVVLMIRYRPPSTRSPITIVDEENTVFTDPENAFTIGEQPTPLAAVATLSRALPTPVDSASITLSGFGDLPLPPGSVLERAVLRVAHRDDGDIHPTNGPRATVTFTGATCTSPQPLTASPGAFLEERINLATVCGLTEPSQLAGLTVTYAVDLADEPPPPEPPEVPVPNEATAMLDGIELDIIFRAPRLRALDGCVTTVPYPGPAGACALVLVQGADSRFVVQGTVYAPTGALDISMQNLTGQVFSRGLIGRHLALTLTPTVGFKRPILGVPPEAVRFTTYPDRTRLATAAVSTAPGDFDTPDDALAIDGTAATASLDTVGRPSARLTLEGFDAPSVRDGAIIDDVVVRIVHQEAGPVLPEVDEGQDGVTTTVHLFDSDGNETTLGPVSLPRRAGLVEDTISLPPIALPEPVTAAQLVSITVDYEVFIDPAATEPATARLDGIAIQVLSGPLVQAQVVFQPGQTTIEGWRVF